MLFNSKLLVLTLGCLLLTFLSASTRVSASTFALPAGFTRELVAEGMSTSTSFVFTNDGILVTEKGGKIRVIEPGGILRAEPYATLHVSIQGERGLNGIALHPKYPAQPYVYVYYTTGPGALNYSGAPANRLSRFRTVDGFGTDEEILIDDIPAETGYHNGGDLLFGKDGKLFVTVGDSGTMSNATDLKSLAGKILRVNAKGKAPRDNPYFGKPKARPEVYAYGFRNPFRIAERAATQSYFVADVGWGKWEELDKLKSKGNYGWPTYEGPCLRNVQCDPTTTDFGKTVPPLYYYDSTLEEGNAIIGGVFAIGANYPAPYKGAYFFGDIYGWVRVLKINRADRVTGEYEFDTGIQPTQFRVGPDKNVYVLDLYGKLYRYVYAP